MLADKLEPLATCLADQERRGTATSELKCCALLALSLHCLAHW